MDVLVNNAGLFEGGKLEDQDAEAIDAMVQVNLTATMQLTRLALPSMLARRRGLIVNNASISGYLHLPGSTTYAATKTGVVAFSESLRRELRGHRRRRPPPRDSRDRDRHARRDATRLRRSTRPPALPSQFTPAQWAARVVRSIEQGDRILGPGGILALGKLASRGPAGLVDVIAARAFRR